MSVAEPRDTIVIRDEVIASGFILDKPLRIIGINASVDGGGRGSVVVVRGVNWAEIVGLSISNSGRTGMDSCLVIENSSNVIVRGVRLSECLYPIRVEGSQNVTIENSVISSFREVPVFWKATIGGPIPLHALTQFFQGHGVYMWWSQNVKIRNNTFLYTHDGVYCQHSYNSVVEGNRFVVGSRYAVHLMYCENVTIAGNWITDYVAGAVLMYSRNVSFVGNVVEKLRRVASVGIILFESNDVVVSENVVKSNFIGIQVVRTPLSDVYTAVVERNLIAFNFIGIYLDEASGTVFARNSIVENVFQVRAPRIAKAQFVGNYWGGVFKRVEIKRTMLDWVIGEIPEATLVIASPGFMLIRGVLSVVEPGSTVLVDEAPQTTPVKPAAHIYATEVGEAQSLATLILTTLPVIALPWALRRLG